MFVRLYGFMPMCSLSQTHTIGFYLSLAEVRMPMPPPFLHCAARIVSPCLWKMCIMGPPITRSSDTRDRRGIAPMHEPTQEFMVSELRRRMSVSIAELTQVLGLPCCLRPPTGNPADARQRFRGL